MKSNNIQRNVDLQLEYKKKQKIKENGITLIALVVTIILLLLLAGVTISQIAGSNGLFQRTRQTVEKYKNSAEEEQIQIGMLEQYVSDFSVVGGSEGEEEKALVSIKEGGLEVTGNVKEQTITVKVIVIGEASKIEYSIDNGITWKPEEGEEVTKIEKEGTEEKETEYTYIFKELELGKSYFVRIKIYDVNGKNIEIISEVVTLNYVMTAMEEDVLEGRTYLTEDGTLKTGTMSNNGEVNETLNAGESYIIPKGYHNGGIIIAKTLKDQTKGNAEAEDISSGKVAWVNGKEIIGTSQKSNICFTGSGLSGGRTWTTVSFSSVSLDKDICSIDGSKIILKKDCKINMKAILWAGRRSNGEVNTGFLRVLINDKVMYTYTGSANSLGCFSPLNSYSISSGSSITIQVYGTDETAKIHTIIIENIM